MGKGVCNNKYKLILAIFLSLTLLIVPQFYAYASPSESELFEQSYEYYLSYKPKKAAEMFKTFLSVFPHSSAADAAMFWLGKSLMQVREFEEAKKVFSELKQQFPHSPFIQFVEREAEEIQKAESLAQKADEKIHDVLNIKNSLEVKLEEAELKLKSTSRDLSISEREKENLHLIVEEEIPIIDELKARLNHLEKKNADSEKLRTDLEEKKKGNITCTEFLKKLIHDREQIDTQKNRLTSEVFMTKGYCNNLRGLFEKEKRETKELHIRIRELNEKVSTLNNVLSQIEERQQDCKTENVQLNNRIDFLAKDKAILESEREKLKEQAKEYEDTLR